MLAIRTSSLLLLDLVWLVSCNVIYNTSIELRERLLENYEKDDMPSFLQAMPLTVAVSFQMTALRDMNELEGEMVTVGYLSLTWLDPRLTWNPMDYAGITYLVLRSDKIWTPNLTLGNPSRRVADFNVELTKIRLLYNGTVILMPGDVFHTRCEYDIYKYPFDKQSCYLSFVSWPHTVNEVLLTIPKNEIVTPFFRENGEWYLRSSSVGSYVKSSLSVAQFSLNLERRSEFFIVNIILPIVSICFLACLVFLIPHESGERIAYTITVLLSFAVFMTLVSDNIPKTSAPMSLLCYYLFALFFGSVLIMLSVVFTSRLFHKDKSVPVCAPYRYLACLLCKRNKKTKRKINKIHVISINESDVPGDMKEDLSKEEKTSKGAGKSGTSETQVTWKEVAEAMDRLCFVMFVVYFTILSGVVVLSVQL